MLIHSESQGDDHVPWAANIGNDVYVIDSELPARALMALKPYLKSDTLERLVNKAYQQR